MLLLVALGGSAGAVARYVMTGWVQHRWGGLFPLGTLAVNVVGCLLLGLLMGLVQEHPLLRPETRALLGIGILGAFTTFSTFGYETSALLHDGRWLWAGVNLGANVLLGLAAVEIGRLLGRLISL
ncbi:MAG TPA: fluoride efflux transporter CrcB [Candidatus Sumerlaeota bacterium]|nr:fluoride efflux transporter CrcB [Candidatus Sumerlaeota bacterium]HOR28063.1 fluoride efflux transporter CrcB [Candidatus Sumerlaeota bacterium]